jgi:hypothetical protein
MVAASAGGDCQSVGHIGSELALKFVNRGKPSSFPQPHEEVNVERAAIKVACETDKVDLDGQEGGVEGGGRSNIDRRRMPTIRGVTRDSGPGRIDAARR